MTRKLSNWSKPGEKPPMVGVWETDFAAPRGLRAFQWFDGAFFHHAECTPQKAYEKRSWPSRCIQSTVRFRGLADKPE